MSTRSSALWLVSAFVLATPRIAAADAVGYGLLEDAVQTDFQYCMVVTLGDQTLDVFGMPVNLGTSAGTILLTGQIDGVAETFDLHAESVIDPARLSFDGNGVYSGSFTPIPFTSISLTGVGGSALAGLSSLAYSFDGSANCIVAPGTPPAGCPLPGPFLATCSGSAALNAFETEATSAGSVVLVTSIVSYYNSIAETELSIEVGVTFAEVLTPGTTAIMAVSHAVGFVPGSFAVSADGFPATYFDVSTDAVLNGPITVCSSYPDADDDDIVDGTTIVETALVLLHGEGEPVSFVDRTFSRDTESNVVCAQVSSLSFFVQAIDLDAANPCSDAPDGTACNDGDICSTGDACTAEVCGGLPEPRSCTPAATTLLRIVPGATPEDSTLSFVWKKGDVAASAQFGDPLGSDTTFLCIYDDDSIVARMEVPPVETCDGGACWKQTTSGFSYRDKAGSQDGVTRLKLKAAAGSRAKVQLKAQGSMLPAVGLPLQEPVTAQLGTTAAGNACIGASWSGDEILSNDTFFSAKQH